ncbi:hypothetical protein [Caballeronia humi]|nr:hypothetical protein [Caballeronia humi]
MTILAALLSHQNFPIAVDKLFVGISVRQSGNTITEPDRSKWNRSMSEMVSHLVNFPELTQMLSLPSHALATVPYQQLDQDVRQLRAAIAERNQVIERLVGSTSWKLTRPLRAPLRLLRGEVSIRDALRFIF